MEALSLRLFGTLRVTCDGSVVDIPARKARALLAYLAVAERAQNREHLAALFWPENSDRRARANLRRGLWTLNQTPAASWLEATTDTIELCREDLEVDVARFTALLERDEAARTLAEAINLYRGPFLQDLYLADSNEFEAWAAARRDHYRRKALDAMHKLVEMHLEEGTFEQAVSLARRQIAIDDLREDAYRQLFWALARSGKRAVALGEYESLRSHLAQELGVEPSKATQAVIDEIQAGVDSVPELKVTSKDPGDAIRSPQTSPQPPVSPYRGLRAYREEDAPYFFGRDDFTDQLLAATRRQALVAVIGPSGSGKTSATPF